MLKKGAPNTEELAEAIFGKLKQRQPEALDNETVASLCAAFLQQAEALALGEDSAPTPVTSEALAKGGSISMAELLGNITMHYRGQAGDDSGLRLEWALDALAQTMYRHTCPSLDDYFKKPIRETREGLAQAWREVGQEGLAREFYASYCQEAVRYYASRDLAASLQVAPESRPREERRILQGLERTVAAKLQSLPKSSAPTPHALAKHTVRMGSARLLKV